MKKPPSHKPTPSQNKMHGKLREGRLDVSKGKGKRFFEKVVAKLLYEHPEHLVAHQKCVKKIAVSIGVQLIKLEKRRQVDVNLIDTAARFHDIARDLEGFLSREKSVFISHDVLGAAILESFGLIEEAELVRNHFCERLVHPITFAENKLPIEEKILIYADARTHDGRIGSLKERRDAMLNRAMEYTDEYVHAIYGPHGISKRDQLIRVIRESYKILEKWEAEWKKIGVKIP